jgi:hypothetical protein
MTYMCRSQPNLISILSETNDIVSVMPEMLLLGQPCIWAAGAYKLTLFSYKLTRAALSHPANLTQVRGTTVTKPMFVGSRSCPVQVRVYRAYSCRNLPCPWMLSLRLNTPACPIRTLKPSIPIRNKHLGPGPNVCETLPHF